MMQRRQFLTLGAAMAIAPSVTHAAYQAMEYQWGMRSDLRGSVQTVIFNFRSSWSLTCQIKEELLAELKTENPAYRAITFIDVDYDTYGPSQWVEQMKIRRRSTLVAMKGSDEIARVENQPQKEVLRTLLDAALTA